MATRLSKDSIFRRYLLKEGDLKLVPLIERALVERGWQSWPTRYEVSVRNEERLWDGYFHPSVDAVAQPLFLYYKFHPRYRHLLLDMKGTVSDVMTLHIGSALHAVVQSMLIELGFTTKEECEVSFADEYRRCSGTVDVRSVALDGNPLVEIKTCSFLPSAPYQSHIAQMQPYLDLGAPEAEYGLLLYIEKAHPHRMREFVVPRDQELLSAIYRKWSLVLEAIDLDDPTMLPLCEGCEAGNKVYRECPAQRVCRIGGVA